MTLFGKDTVSDKIVEQLSSLHVAHISQQPKVIERSNSITSEDSEPLQGLSTLCKSFIGNNNFVESSNMTVEILLSSNNK